MAGDSSETLMGDLRDTSGPYDNALDTLSIQSSLSRSDSFIPVTVQFRRLSVEVSDKSGLRRTILHDLNGTFRAGTLTAIMGASGTFL
jgi:hypothetical protein